MVSAATSEGNEGPHKQPKKPRRALEQVQAHLQWADETDSPKSSPRDPDELGHNVRIPGTYQKVQERPTCDRNECINETVVKNQGTALGAAEGNQVK